MTEKELTKAIKENLNQMAYYMQLIHKATIQYADSHEALDLFDVDGGETVRLLDGLGFLNGWVIDRLMHRTDKSKGSLVRKIRKAQGYNA